LTSDREWEVEVFPLVTGQWSVKEKEWLQTLRIFGIGKEDGKRIIVLLPPSRWDPHVWVLQ